MRNCPATRQVAPSDHEESSQHSACGRATSPPATAAGNASPQGLTDIVLGSANKRTRALFAATLATALAYAGLGWTIASGHFGTDQKAHATLRRPMVVEHIVELPSPPLVQPEVEEKPEPVQPPPPVKPRPPAVKPPPPSVKAPPPRAPQPTVAPPSVNDSPPPPAQAGQVVAAEAPIDFTSFTMASGKATSYAGGVTAFNGTAKRAIHTNRVDPTATAGPRSAARSLARPVRLEARTWSCPWPREADLLNVNRQSVVLQVHVAADGKVNNVQVLSDPGHGFGKSARRCAFRNRFDPAADFQGRPIAGSSTLKVHFTR